MLNKNKRKMGKPRGKVTRAARQGRRGISDSLIPLPRIPRGMNFLAERVRSELHWSLNGTLNNAGSVYAGSYAELNYPGTPVLGASTVPAAWTDFNQLYQSMRVLSCKIKFEATNKETFPVTMYLFRVGQTQASGATPAANDIVSATTLRGATENPTFCDRQLGSAASGRSTGTITKMIHLSDVIGTPWPGSVDEYSGTGNATTSLVPANLLYEGYGIYSTDVGTNLSSGVAYRLSLVFDTIFFQPRNQTS